MNAVKTAVCVIVAMGAIGTSEALAIDLAENGGFETGDTSGWQDLTGPTQPFTVESTDPFAGSFNGQIENTVEGTAAVVKQANKGAGLAVGGAEVTVKFWARGPAAEGGVHFAELFSELDGGGTSKSEILGGAPLFPDAQVWTPYEFVTTLGPDVSGGVTLQFAAVTGANPASTSTLEIDNVSIETIPEPASMALLGMGGLAMLARRRRHV